MSAVTVYDPATCCSTGVCGPEADPRLVQFAGDLDWLKRQGVEVERINLSQEPERFLGNPAIMALLETGGDRDLPAIVVGGEVKSHGRFPSRDELASLAGVAGEAPVLSGEVRELIAIGAAIGASCEPCLKFHYDKARKLGVSSEAMREAVALGEMVKNASAEHLLNLADELLGPAAETTGAPAPAASEVRRGTTGCCG
jgi:AhpD family alkylhydroperoxidase